MRKQFTTFRRSLLYTSEQEANPKIVVDVSGMSTNNTSQNLRATIVDQTHLTAEGMFIQLERRWEPCVGPLSSVGFFDRAHSDAENASCV